MAQMAAGATRRASAGTLILVVFSELFVDTLGGKQLFRRSTSTQSGQCQGACSTYLMSSWANMADGAPLRGGSQQGNYPGWLRATVSGLRPSEGPFPVMWCSIVGTTVLSNLPMLRAALSGHQLSSRMRQKVLEQR